MSSGNEGSISLRHATYDDIPVIITLLLTSFRQFLLFDYLYTPLRHNPANATDTIYFWTRRMKLALADPACAVVVAQLTEPAMRVTPRRSKSRSPSPSSWQMLDWIDSHRSRLPQKSDKSGTDPAVVGFAIWRAKNPRPRQLIFADASNRPQSQWGLSPRVVPTLELWFYGMVYRRKDVDQERYAAYLSSEEEHTKIYYKDTCICLDNLCVDFRYQGMHIGSSLTEWGLGKARSSKQIVRTETSQENVPFYESMGFNQIGVWEVPVPHSEDKLSLPVLEWAP